MAVGAEECRALCLDDTEDGSFAAGGADFTGAVVDAVGILVTARLVEGVAVGAVAECGAFVTDGFVKDFEGVGSDEFELVFPKAVGRSLGVDCGTVEDFAGVKIADAGDSFLVEHQDFDWARSAGGDGDPVIDGRFEGVGAEFRAVEEVVEFGGGEKGNRPESTAIPEPK